jgi:hypothetical protein
MCHFRYPSWQCALEQVFGLLVVSQQAVDQFVAYVHCGSLVKCGSFLPNDRLHKSSYTLPHGDSNPGLRRARKKPCLDHV